VIAHEDAVEAELLGVAGLFARAAAVPSAPACSITATFSRRLIAGTLAAVRIVGWLIEGRSSGFEALRLPARLSPLAAPRC
jgi:hypothetical protein